MREGAAEGARPKLGRPKKPDSPDPQPTVTPPVRSESQYQLMHNDAIGYPKQIPEPEVPPQPVEVVPAEVQNEEPVADANGAKIQTRSRPVRSTRNPSPCYV